MSGSKKKKSRSKRGSRTHGGGSAKKRRHSGNKGGKGLAGSHKHGWMKINRESPQHFGKYGFKRPSQIQKEVNVANVGEIDEYADELLEEGLAEKEGDEIVIDVSDLEIDKVLGGGQVTRPMKIIAKEFSGKAKKKLEESGGTAATGES